MSRAKHRGHRPPGLFGFQQGAPAEQVDEVPDNPKHRACPACGARPGEPCSRPSRNGGRQPLRAKSGDPLRRGFHPARAVIPDPDPEDVEAQTRSATVQAAAHAPEPAAPEPEGPPPATTRRRPSQPQEPDWDPPSARAKANLKWAMNL